jgi:signal transduction histidine kinase/ActR/RegA family two-component response regulator
VAAEAGAPPEERVLLLPPTQRDAEAIRAVFSGQGIDCRVHGSMPQLCRALSEGAAALVISEEALLADSPALLAFLGAQPVWADLPIVVLSRSGSESPALAELLPRAGNVSVVERPVRISTFLSIVRAAMRSRARQYQVRQHMLQMQRSESERTQLLESERSARAEAERAGRMKDEFLATLSHEIRTPLNAILGWTHILALTRSPEDLAKGLSVIERNARAQAQIVADLLDMNRIINGKIRLDVQRIQLAPVVQAAVDTITPAAEAKGIRLQVILDPSTGPVSGDPERLQQVFWNLLSNAVKFTPRGERVQVLLQCVSSHLEVSVADTGEGIEPEFLPHVFDRFRQADGSTTRRVGGLGLGLAIVKQLVELHGGTVSARSPGPGKGSAFTVALPLAPLHGDEPSPAERRHPKAGTAAPTCDENDDIRGVRVLVVDDELDARDLVRRLLEGRQAQVATAASAGEALDLIQQLRPDILISDVGMPGEDGYSLLRRLRRLTPEAGGETVAIALTAYARAEDRVTAMRAGFQYHISKPVEPMELIATVASAARRKA